MKNLRISINNSKTAFTVLSDVFIEQDRASVVVMNEDSKLISTVPINGTKVISAEKAKPQASKTELTGLSKRQKNKQMIKKFKKLRKEGWTYKEIAQMLNEKDIPTFSGKGEWHAQTIHRHC